MKHNVGRTDRSIRIVLGILIAAAGIYFKSWWGLLSIVMFATAFLEWCPIFKVLGISTRKISAA